MLHHKITAERIKPIPPRGAMIFFLIYGLLLAGATIFVMPFLEAYGWMNIVAWFFCGSVFVFMPLLVHALIIAKKEGRNGILDRLRVKKMTVSDWKWFLIGFVAIGLGTGVILGINKLLVSMFPFIPVLDMQPPFMHFYGFEPSQRWMLLLWLPSYLFIIFGEEFMWRGILLPRMEKHNNKTSWLWNALLWLCFHAAFGIDLMIVLLPIILVVPYVVWKRKNTTLGILLHGLYNGAGFLVVAFGLVA